MTDANTALIDAHLDAMDDWCAKYWVGLRLHIRTRPRRMAG